MPINIVCQHCGHVRYLTQDDVRSGRWRDTACPVCSPRHDDDREIVDDDTREETHHD